tara:strand:- start:2265 stop:2744 length:480 start_codon:yes stop_codon:yes gene_type:complete
MTVNKLRVEKIAISRGYSVTEDGRLLNPEGVRVGSTSDVYERTKIKVDSVDKKIKTHRLQAYQKYGDAIYNNGIVVRHKNGNPLDNSKDNILIGSHSDNMMDIPDHIRMGKAMHATSFVRKYDKKEVRDFYNDCKSYKYTMLEFDISSKGTLHFILNSP